MTDKLTISGRLPNLARRVMAPAPVVQFELCCSIPFMPWQAYSLLTTPRHVEFAPSMKTGNEIRIKRRIECFYRRDLPETVSVC